MNASKLDEQPRSEGADRPSQSIQSFSASQNLMAIPTLGSEEATTKSKGRDSGSLSGFVSAENCAASH
jgi:hypothetical protein